jgi:hypothetical protein
MRELNMSFPSFSARSGHLNAPGTANTFSRIMEQAFDLMMREIC